MIRRAEPRRRPRRRRWPRVVLLILVVVLGTVGVAVWRLTSDRERLTRFLVERARVALGVELSLRTPAQIELWPRPALRLDGVRAGVAGDGPLLAELESVNASVPWRALWSRELALGGVTVVNPRVQREALLDWLGAAAQADAGPPAPLRWPSTDRDLVVQGLRWIDASGAPSSAITLDVMIGPIATGVPLAVDVVWRAPEQVSSLALRGVPRDTPEGLALDQLAATLAPEATPSLRLRATGHASFASAAAYAVDARIDALRWPGWLAAAPPGIDAAQRVQLNAHLDRAGEAFALAAKGALGGSTVDARLAVPDAVFDAPDRGTLLRRLMLELRGSATIDRLEVEGVLLEGIELDAADAQAEAP